MPDSSSESDSSSSSSDSRERRRERKRAARKEKKEKRRKEKKHESRHDKEKKHKKHKKHKSDDKRSIITGKRIQRADGASADAEGEARREAMRLAMNEGEDEAYGSTSVSTGKASEAAQQALSDPAKMLELMRASDAAQRAKRQRLGAIKRGGGDDYAGAISHEYSAHRGSGGGRRTAYDAADYMKPESGF